MRKSTKSWLPKGLINSK